MQLSASPQPRGPCLSETTGTRRSRHRQASAVQPTFLFCRKTATTRRGNAVLKQKTQLHSLRCWALRSLNHGYLDTCGPGPRLFQGRAFAGLVVDTCKRASSESQTGEPAESENWKKTPSYFRDISQCDRGCVHPPLRGGCLWLKVGMALFFDYGLGQAYIPNILNRSEV